MQQCKLPVEKIYTNKNKEKKANIKSKNKLAKNKKQKLNELGEDILKQ